MEEQKTKVKALNDRLKQVEKKEEARAETPRRRADADQGRCLGGLKTGQPVHIVETQNTDVLLYGVIEPTLGYMTNVDKAGRSTVGFNTSWFSGNRWGIFVTQKVFPEYNFNLWRGWRASSSCRAATWTRPASCSIATPGSVSRARRSASSASAARTRCRVTSPTSG